MFRFYFVPFCLVRYHKCLSKIDFAVAYLKPSGIKTIHLARFGSIYNRKFYHLSLKPFLLSISSLSLTIQKDLLPEYNVICTPRSIIHCLLLKRTVSLFLKLYMYISPENLHWRGRLSTRLTSLFCKKVFKNSGLNGANLN